MLRRITRAAGIIEDFKFVVACFVLTKGAQRKEHSKREVRFK